MPEIIEISKEKHLSDVVDFTRKLYKNHYNYDDIVKSAESRFNRVFKLNIPDSRFFMLADKGKIKGHLWVAPNQQINYEGKSIATFGFYECEENDDSAKVLLSEGHKHAAKTGAQFIVGPQDYATWYDYRFVHPSATPPVWAEPYNKDYYIRHFTDFGFGEICSYETTYTEKPYIDPRYHDLAERFKKMGVVMKYFAFTEDEYRRLYDIEREAWSKQFLYCDIPYEEYRSFRGKLPDTLVKELSFGYYHPEFGLCGFIYVYPNKYDKTGKSVMIKSIGAILKKELAGMGVWGTSFVHELTFKLGYQRLYHALMRSSNYSAVYSKDKTVLEKQYSLYGKDVK